MSVSVVTGLVLHSVCHSWLITQIELVHHARSCNCPDRTLPIANILKNVTLGSFIFSFHRRFLIGTSTFIFPTWFIVLVFLRNNSHLSIYGHIWPYSSLRRLSRTTCITITMNGGTVSPDRLLAGVRPADSQLKSTTRASCCIYTVYLLMMGYKYAPKHVEAADEINCE
jgi:hypothetical protein